MDRRKFLANGVSLAALAGFTAWAPRAWAAPPYAVARSEAEWRRMLTPEQYRILLQQGTEDAYSSPLLNEHRKGTFSCIGCGQHTFSSDTKYDSKTGWPSFWTALPGALLKTVDESLAVTRTEVHCSRCGGHLGHIFQDGPPPTGLRYCMDGAVLTFQPSA